MNIFDNNSKYENIIGNGLLPYFKKYFMIHLSVVSVCNNQIHEILVICKGYVQWKSSKELSGFTKVPLILCFLCGDRKNSSVKDSSEFTYTPICSRVNFIFPRRVITFVSIRMTVAQQVTAPAVSSRLSFPNLFTVVIFFMGQ